MSGSLCRRWGARFVSMGAMGLLAAACSAAAGSGSADMQEDPLDGVGGSAMGGQGEGDGENDGNGDLGSGGGVPDELDHCADMEVTPTLVDVSMFIAVDKSGSMSEAGKWSAAHGAFTSFFTNPAADSLNVALGFWPFAMCSDALCSVAGCAVPTVPLGSLADTQHEITLVAAFTITGPGGATPMSAALGGATQWAVQRQLQEQGRERVVVVFLTDGEPTACDLTLNGITQHAAAAHAQAGVLTFAVGLQGSFEGTLNAIAQAGQTEQGFFIGSGDVQGELLAALEAIRDSVMACSYAMPESDDPQHPIDPALVNVSHTPGGGSPATIPQVAGEQACGPGGGWYYDNPADPQSITLCDATCDGVQGDPAAQIKIVLGCATVTY